ncbi:MAG: hypothetical protein KF729_27180 [Sandaracinaceae bacterium]|nr:hypothetical protein [Sandaracinaceae bacterium]
MRRAAVITFSFALPALAAAQAAPERGGADRDATDLEAARAAYAEGEAAAEALQWGEAYVAFQRSYERSGAPSAGFNAAMALRAQGRHVAAAEALEALLARHADWEHAGSVAERLAEERARVATLHLEALEPPSAALRLDGRVIALAPGQELALDAGEHVLSAAASGHEPHEEALSLAFGERRSLSIRLAPRAALEAAPSGGEDVAASPWLWLVVGAVVVAGVVVTAVLLDDAAQLSADSPTVVRFP